MPKSQCNYCSKCFSTKFNLNKHLKNVHNVQWNAEIEKAYTCAYCNKKYNYRRTLIEHMQRKHAILVGTLKINKSNRANIKCCTCGVGFINMKSLRHHLSIAHLISIEYSKKVFNTREGKPMIDFLCGFTLFTFIMYKYKPYCYAYYYNDVNSFNINAAYVRMY
jgi:hypothetical protein